MNREIPNLNASILHPLVGHKDKDRTEENYIKKIEKFERGCEKSLIETFGRLSIDSMVKTDPYSLPYNNEIVVTLNGESYLNGPYEFHRVARKIVKEVLDKNLWKLRFYLFVNVLTNQPDQHPFMKHIGQVEYRFRYYLKETEN
jgi:hypothetical protein